MNVWLLAVGSVVFVSSLSLTGLFTLSLNENRLMQILELLCFAGLKVQMTPYLNLI